MHKRYAEVRPAAPQLDKAEAFFTKENEKQEAPNGYLYSAEDNHIIQEVVGRQEETMHKINVRLREREHWQHKVNDLNETIQTKNQQIESLEEIIAKLRKENQEMKKAMENTQDPNV